MVESNQNLGWARFRSFKRYLSLELLWPLAWHPCCSLAWLSVAEDHSSLYTAVSAGYMSMCLPVGGTACVVPDAVVPVHPFVGDQNAAVAKGLVVP